MANVERYAYIYAGVCPRLKEKKNCLQGGMSLANDERFTDMLGCPWLI